jgi:hypothetical protein
VKTAQVFLSVFNRSETEVVEKLIEKGMTLRPRKDFFAEIRLQ